MKTRVLGVVCAVLCIQLADACAQDTNAPARAQREADNPLRMIIEAGRIKSRTKPVETPADKPLPRPETAKAPARAASAASAAAALRPSPSPSQVAAPRPVLTERAAPEPRSEPAAALAPEPQVGKPAPVASVEPTPAPTPEAAPPEPAPLISASPARAPALAVLALADYVEPVLPARIKSRLRTNGEVILDFTVNADGTVSDAAVRSSSDKALGPIALDAVRQWRYQPIAAAQPHSVQLVFRIGN